MSAWWRRKTVLAGGLAATVVVVAVIRPDFRTAETSAGSSNRTGQTDGRALPDVPVVDLRLERLEAEREELPDADRDPFRFRPKPQPPPPRAAVRPAPRPEEFTAPPPGPPPVPAIPVKYMGITVSRGQRVAHFTDTRGAVFSGKEGDIIEGRYRVLRIGMDSVELAYLDGRGRQTIRMTGQ